MKEHVVTLWNWVVLAVVLGAIGVLTVSGAGRKRGSRVYGWRIALWTVAMGLMGMAAAGPVKAKPIAGTSCLDTAQAGHTSTGEPGVAGAQGLSPAQPDPRVTCYKPLPPPPPEDEPPMVKCYEPGPPPDPDEQDKPVITPPEPMPTCYDAAVEPPKPLPSCYEPVAEPPKPPEPPEPPPPPPTCYAPIDPER